MKNKHWKEKSLWSFLVSNRNYLNLWLGGTISLFGDHLNRVASILITLSVTNGSGLSAGVVICVRFVLRMLGGNIGGVLADRYDRRFLLIILDVIMAFVAMSFILVSKLSDVRILYGLTAIMGFAEAIFTTSRTAFMADIVEKQSLTHAFAFNQFSAGVSIILGNALGGATVGFWGCETAFLINGLTFLVSAYFTWKVKMPKTPNKTERGCGSPILELIAGLRYLSKHPFLVKMICLDLCWALGGGGVYIIVAMLNYQRLGNSEQNLGVIYSMAGVGALVATMFCPWIGRHFRRDIFLLGASCVLEGLIFSILVFQSSLLIVAVLFWIQTTVSFIFGLIYGPLLVNSIPDNLRGRVLGVEEGLFLPVYGLSSALYGFMLNKMDVTFVGLISGGIMVFAGIAWLMAMWWGFLLEASNDFK